jgi:cytochrome c551/c552
MKRRLRISALAVLILLAAAQLVQPETPNPRVNPARRLWSDSHMNPRVTEIMQRACGNCHSYETKWPWYVKISPVSWFMARHVEQGRAKLNFDEWSSAAAADQLEEIYDSIAKKKMPLWSYLLMHPEARLSQADRDTLLAWADGKLEPGSK